MKKHIKKIIGTAFKGRNFTQELSPLTIITGDNFIGKTAMAELIRVGLLGYSPRIGKQPAKTFGFAGAPDGAAKMETALHFSDETFIARTFEIKRGKVDAKVIDNTGFSIPPVLLDTSEFLNKSGPEKVRFIFDQLDLAALGITTAQITARLKRDCAVETPSEESELALAGIVADVETTAKVCAEQKLTVQDWIALIVEGIKKKKTDAKAVLDDMAGMIQGSTQLRAESGLAVAEDVSSFLEEKRALFVSESARLKVMENYAAEYLQRMTRRANAQKALEGLSDPAELIAQLEQQQQDLSAQTALHKSATAEHAATMARHNSDFSSASRRVEELTRDIQNIESELMATLAKDRCPLCDSCGTAWKSALSDKSATQIGELNEKITAARTSAEEAQKASVIASQLHATAKAEDAKVNGVRETINTVGARVRELRAQKTKFDSATSALSAIVIGEAPDVNAATTLRATLETLRQDIARLDLADKQHTAAIADQQRAAEATAKHEQKTAELEVCKLAEKSMMALKEETMSAAFNGFCEKIRLFTDGILPGRIEYREGEIGYFAGASFATLEFFSGTEEMITCAGLSVALAQGSPFKIVIMDELGRLTHGNKLKLLKKMESLLESGVIDQFIGIDADVNDWQAFDMNSSLYQLVELS